MICGWRNLIKNIPHFAKFNEEVRLGGLGSSLNRKYFTEKEKINPTDFFSLELFIFS